MADKLKLVYRPQGAPVGQSQTIEVKSWASVGGQIGQLADECDSILVYQDDKLVLRYDNDGVS